MNRVREPSLTLSDLSPSFTSFPWYQAGLEQGRILAVPCALLSCPSASSRHHISKFHRTKPSSSSPISSRDQRILYEHACRERLTSMNHPPRFTPRTLSPGVEPAGTPPGSVYHDDNPLTDLPRARTASSARVDHIVMSSNLFNTMMNV